MIKGLLDPKIDFIFKNIFGAEKNKKWKGKNFRNEYWRNKRSKEWAYKD